MKCLAWQHTPSIVALGRQSHVNHREFKASLVYVKSSRSVRGTQLDPVAKTKQTTATKNNLNDTLYITLFKKEGNSRVK